MSKQEIAELRASLSAAQAELHDAKLATDYINHQLDDMIKQRDAAVAGKERAESEKASR